MTGQRVSLAGNCDLSSGAFETFAAGGLCYAMEREGALPGRAFLRNLVGRGW